jgi:hypothetical protein
VCRKKIEDNGNKKSTAALPLQTAVETSEIKERCANKPV